MAVKTKKEKKSDPGTAPAAATVGTGNPGIASKASAASDMDDLLASAGVKTKVAEPTKGKPLATVVLDMTYDVPLKDDKGNPLLHDNKPVIKKENVIDLWVDAVRREKAAAADKQLYGEMALDKAEELRVDKSRNDGKFQGSVYVHGNKESVTYVTTIPWGTKPTEEVPKEKILAALESQFGENWRTYVIINRKMVLSKSVDVPKLKQVIEALKQHGLNFGDLIEEEIEYKPTEELQIEETMNPVVAAKVKLLNDAGVLKKKTRYFRGQ